MKTGISIGFLGIALLVFSAFSARASSLPPVPGVLNGTSTDESVRIINSDISDWQNEQTQVGLTQQKTCRDAQLMGDVAGFFSGVASSISLPQLPAMPVLLTPSVSLADIPAFVNSAFSGVSMQATESTELANIQASASSIGSQSDSFAVAIGAQQLAITVSNQIYAVAIEVYAGNAAAEDAVSTLDGDADTCIEDMLRTQRDSAMITASQYLISLYSQYNTAAENELGEESGGSVN